MSSELLQPPEWLAGTARRAGGAGLTRRPARLADAVAHTDSGAFRLMETFWPRTHCEQPQRCAFSGCLGHCGSPKPAA